VSRQAEDRHQQGVQRLRVGYGSFLQQRATCRKQGRRVRAYGAQSGLDGRAVETTTPKRAFGEEETTQAT
jgi:hypothetical protein